MDDGDDFLGNLVPAPSTSALHPPPSKPPSPPLLSTNAKQALGPRPCDQQSTCSPPELEHCVLFFHLLPLEECGVNGWPATRVWQADLRQDIVGEGQSTHVEPCWSVA